MQISTLRASSPPLPDAPSPPGPEVPAPRAGTGTAHQGLVAAASSSVPEQLLAASLDERFRATFGSAAQDPEAFHSLLDALTGGHDAGRAEPLRQRAAAGDFSFLPRVEFVPSAMLGGASGSYSASEQTVYLNRERSGDPEELRAAFTEQVGRHLAAELRGSSGAGADPVPRNTRLGPPRDAHSPTATESHGGSAAGQTFRVVSSAVGRGVSDVGAAVTGALGRAGNGLLETASAAASHAWSMTTTLGNGMWGITGGAIGALLSDGFAAAWDRFWGGVDAVLFRAPAQGLSLALDVTERLLESTERLLPEGWLRNAVGNVRSRILDATRSLVMGSFGTVTGALRNLSEAGSNLTHGVDLVRRGESESGLRQLALGVVKVPQTAVDAVLFAGGKLLSAVQTLAFVEAPGRRLHEHETADLTRVFGGSIDLEQVRIKEGSAGLFSLNRRPFTLGNTIYLKNAVDDPNTALREAMPTLVSEATHVWQFQNGGTDYVSEALGSQAFGHAYDWARDAGTVAWQDLEPEQQDAFLNFAYASGAFQTEPPAFPASTVTPPGMTRADLNRYLAESLLTLRSRQGAP